MFTTACNLSFLTVIVSDDEMTFSMPRGGTTKIKSSSRTGLIEKTIKEHFERENRNKNLTLKNYKSHQALFK